MIDVTTVSVTCVDDSFESEPTTIPEQSWPVRAFACGFGPLLFGAALVLECDPTSLWFFVLVLMNSIWLETFRWSTCSKALREAQRAVHEEFKKIRETQNDPTG